MVSRLLLGLVPIILLCPICDGGLAQLRRAVTHFFNPYGYIVDFGHPMNNFKFAYVIIRTGFRAPDNTLSNTFPSDKNYLTGRWKRGQLTRTGGKLVEMLGRSMEDTRYGLHMERWNEKNGPVRISSIKKEYAKASVERFAEGYFKEIRERFRNARYTEASFDKSDLFEDSTRCSAYNTLWNNVKEVQEKHFIEKPENQEFLSELRKYIGENINPGGEWQLCSLEHVYWLWDILEFERVTRNRKPRWLTKEVRKRIDEFVHEYLKESIHGDNRMSKYLVGPLLNNIIDKDTDGYTRLHAHVTDERLFSALKSLLTGAPATTAEYGETIMFDVDDSGNVEVLNYYPVSNIYTKLPVPFTTFDKFKAFYSNLIITDDQWNKACKTQPDYSTTATAKGAGLGNPSHWKAPTVNGASYEHPNREYDKDNAQPGVSDQGSYEENPPRRDQTIFPNSSPSPSKLPHDSQSGTTTAHAESEAPLTNGESPSKRFGWYTETYKKEEYITRTQYFEMANTDEGNGETSTKKNKHAVHPVLAEYTPWRPHVKDDLANSSEDEDSLKPKNSNAVDSNLTSKPRNGGTYEDRGAHGLGADYKSGNGEYRPDRETGLGGSRPLEGTDLRGMRSDSGHSKDGSPSREDTGTRGLGANNKSGNGEYRPDGESGLGRSRPLEGTDLRGMRSDTSHSRDGSPSSADTGARGLGSNYKSGNGEYPPGGESGLGGSNPLEGTDLRGLRSDSDLSRDGSPSSVDTGARGLGSYYKSGNGEYRPGGETGLGESKPLDGTDLRGLGSNNGHSLDGSPPRGDTASSGLGSLSKTRSGGLDSYTGSDLTSTGSFDKSGNAALIQNGHKYPPFSRQLTYDNSQQKSGAGEPWSYGSTDSDRQRSLGRTDHRGLGSNDRFSSDGSVPRGDAISGGLGSFKESGTGVLQSYSGLGPDTIGSFDKSRSGDTGSYGNGKPPNSQRTPNGHNQHSFNDKRSDSFSNNQYPSPIVDKQLPLYQVPEEKPTRVVSSASLSHLHVDLPDIDQFEKMLPKKGEKVYATGMVEKTDRETRRKTVQHSKFHMVANEEAAKYKDREGCFDVNGIRVDCTFVNKFSEDEHLVHSATIRTEYEGFIPR